MGRRRPSREVCLAGSWESIRRWLFICIFQLDLVGRSESVRIGKIWVRWGITLANIADAEGLRRVRLTRTLINTRFRRNPRLQDHWNFGQNWGSSACDEFRKPISPSLNQWRMLISGEWVILADIIRDAVFLHAQQVHQVGGSASLVWYGIASYRIVLHSIGWTFDPSVGCEGACRLAQLWMQHFFFIAVCSAAMTFLGQIYVSLHNCRHMRNNQTRKKKGTSILRIAALRSPESWHAVRSLWACKKQRGFSLCGQSIADLRRALPFCWPWAMRQT